MGKTACALGSVLLIAVSSMAAAAGDAPAPRWKDRTAEEWACVLGEGDLGARREAAYALYQLADEGRGAQVLASALNDDDAYVRRTAVAALRKMGLVAVPALQRALGSPDALLRDPAAWALVEIQGIGAFDNESADVRALAAGRPLRRYVDDVEELVEPLCRLATNDLVPRVRAAALRSLGFIGSRLSVEARERAIAVIAARAVKEEDPDARCMLANAATCMLACAKDDDRRMVAVLMTCATPQRWSRARALALAGLGAVKDLPPQALGLALQASGESDPVIRRAALQALRPAASTARALEVLTDALADGDSAVRIEAARVLAGVGEKAAPAVPALMDALEKTDDEKFCQEVAVALAAMGSVGRALLPTLRRAFSERRANAGLAYAICFLEDTVDADALHALTEIACSDNLHAQALLGRLGSRAAGAVPRVMRALESAPSAERGGYVQLLGALGPTARPARALLLRLRSTAEGALLEQLDDALARIPARDYPE